MRYFVFILLLLGIGINVHGDSKFDYLKIRGNKVKTTHQARYKIKINKKFKPLGEFHHQPVYGEKQFNVSLTAFSDGKNIIMVHAETHTDGSGGLDYSKLKSNSLSGLPFTSREQCASAEDEAELSANPQIIFLKEKGFSVSTPFFLKQFLTTDEKGLAEVVISYGRRVESCAENAITDDFRKQIEQELKSAIKVEKTRD